MTKTRAVYEIQGYTVVLDKIIFVTRIFEARNDEGFQFNIRFEGDTRISVKSATMADATLERQMLLKALKDK